MKVSLEFYLRDDVVQISRELLGKVLCTKINGQVTKAIITETEAYAGVSDKASRPRVYLIEWATCQAKYRDVFMNASIRIGFFQYRNAL